MKNSLLRTHKTSEEVWRILQIGKTTVIEELDFLHAMF